MKGIIGAGVALALTAGAANAVTLTYNFSGNPVVGEDSNLWQDSLTFSSNSGQGPDVTVTATDYNRNTGSIAGQQQHVLASFQGV